MIKKVLRIFLLLVGLVTITDILVIHWILRLHRLYHGQHVLLAESSLLVLACSVMICVLQWSQDSATGQTADYDRAST